VRYIVSILVATVLFCNAAPHALAASKDKASVTMLGLKIVEDKDAKKGKKKKYDKRIPPRIIKLFPGKKLIVDSAKKGSIGVGDKLKMSSPDKKDIILTGKKIVLKGSPSFTYDLEALWKEKKGKKKRWARESNTVRRPIQADLYNVPVVELEEGDYAVLVITVLPKVKK